MASPTPNKGYTYPAHGGSVNSWDTPIDADFDQIDLNVGGVYLITATSTTAAVTFSSNAATVPSSATSITPNTSIAQNLFYRVAGAITSTMTILFPTVGSLYVVANEASSGTLKVNTTAGTSAVSVAAGGNNLIVTSTYASQSANIVGQFPAKIYTTPGSGNPATSATAGSAEGDLTTAVWDAVNKQLNFCITTGTSATAVFMPTNPRVTPEGYLTTSTDASNPILTADAASKTAVYYTPLVGNWTLTSDGTTFYPFQFSQMSLSLTAGAHAANSIYDVFIYQSTTGSSVIIGTGPAWTTATAGSGARGSGAGTTQLSKFNGLWTNAVQATLTNGATTYTCPVNQGIYLGSISIDGSAGQVTCHRSYGQNRKFGIWNNYNRQRVFLRAGDNTATWGSSNSAFRFSNASSGNSLQVFTGLAEEPIDMKFAQRSSAQSFSLGPVQVVGIAWNSTSAFSGTVGMHAFGESAGTSEGGVTMVSDYISPPALGIQQAYSAENGNGTVYVFTGTEAGMALRARWRG